MLFFSYAIDDPAPTAPTSPPTTAATGAPSIPTPDSTTPPTPTSTGTPSPSPTPSAPTAASPPSAPPPSHPRRDNQRTGCPTLGFRSEVPSEPVRWGGEGGQAGVPGELARWGGAWWYRALRRASLLLLPHPVILSEASQSDAKSKDPEDARFTTTAQTFSPKETHPPLTKLDPETPPHGRSLPEPRLGPPLTHILPRLCAKKRGEGGTLRSRSRPAPRLRPTSRLATQFSLISGHDTVITGGPLTLFCSSRPPFILILAASPEAR